MKSKPSNKIEEGRITKGLLASNSSCGNNGAFYVHFKKRIILDVIVSDQGGWEHVSVSLLTRTPTWKEMCFIKDLFWNDDEVVIQYHPAKADYINQHPFCLHLWKPVGETIPMPPLWMIGIKK